MRSWSLAEVQDETVTPVVCVSVTCQFVVNQKSSQVAPVSEVSAIVFKSCSKAGSYTSNHEDIDVPASLANISEMLPDKLLFGQKGSLQVAGWDRWKTDQSLLLRKVI